MTNRRQELIEKFERNMRFIHDFKQRYKEFLDQKHVWNERAFADGSITHLDYYNALVKTSEYEYSAQQYDAIKTVHIEEALLGQYIRGVDNQYESLIKIDEALKAKLP